MSDAPFSAGQQTSDRSWLESPCSRCHQSPCCRNLPVTNLPIRTVHDLAVARDLLGHENIEIGLKEDGVWTLFYTRSCRFLDPASARCTIHGSDRQPTICKQYDAQRCWYRGVFASTLSSAMIRLNQKRLEWILDRVDCDESGEIRGVPDWDLMMRKLAEIPLAMAAQTVRITGLTSREEVTGADSKTVRELAFPPGRPRRIGHFDLIRFRLGFPGVSLGITGDEWYFLLDAAPLPGGPAAGAHVAEYHLSPEAASECVVVGYADSDTLFSLCTTDGNGRISGYPEPEAVRAAVASRQNPRTSAFRAS